MNASKRSLLAAGVGTAAALAIGIPLMTASEATTTTTDATQLTAELNGANEVPPADPNGEGMAFVFGAASSPNTLCYVLFVDRIATPVAAHIHRGAEGVNGPVVVPLRAPADGSTARCATTTRAANILANPQNFYVNVHNAPFPDGAIRGQLG
jgi:CHRD domain